MANPLGYLALAALVVQLAINHCMLVHSQGILSEEEAAYVHPQKSAKRLLQQPEDPMVTLLRNRLPSSRIIAGRGGYFPINETVRGRPCVGDLVVQKGVLEGLARVTRAPCLRRQLRPTTRLVWSDVTASFKFKASVNGVRVLGMASVQLRPATVDMEVVGLSVKMYRVPRVMTSSVTLSSLKRLVRLRMDVSRQLMSASQVALRSFLSGEARKVVEGTLESLQNEAMPLSVC